MAIDHSVSAFAKPGPRKRKKNHSRKKRTSEHSDMVREADSLLRLLVLRRDGDKCLKCGKTRTLQAAHIFPKSHYPRLRFELDNIVSLDVGCHLYWAHKDPIGFTEWINEKFPGRAERLRIANSQARKIDMKELLIVLRDTARKQGLLC